MLLLLFSAATCYFPENTEQNEQISQLKCCSTIVRNIFSECSMFFFHVLLFVFYSIAIYVWSRKNTILWINQIQIIEQTKFHLPLTIFCACCEGLLSYCILFYFFFVFFSFDSMWPRICGLECTFVHKKAHNQPIYYTIHNKQAN